MNRAICVTSPSDEWENHRNAVFKTLNGCIVSFIILLLDESLADEHGWIHGLVPSCCESVLGIYCYADEKEERARVGEKTPGGLCRKDRLTHRYDSQSTHTRSAFIHRCSTTEELYPEGQLFENGTIPDPAGFWWVWPIYPPFFDLNIIALLSVIASCIK